MSKTILSRDASQHLMAFLLSLTFMFSVIQIGFNTHYEYKTRCQNEKMCITAQEEKISPGSECADAHSYQELH